MFFNEQILSYLYFKSCTFLVSNLLGTMGKLNYIYTNCLSNKVVINIAWDVLSVPLLLEWSSLCTGVGPWDLSDTLCPSHS